MKPSAIDVDALVEEMQLRSPLGGWLFVMGQRGFSEVNLEDKDQREGRAIQYSYVTDGDQRTSIDVDEMKMESEHYLIPVLW